ncbi:hypothetical protein AB0G67_45220 [Streptomyces sp. NPDC021056]|uniref:hypothetical protein n=1 Tax=Streptomyces sp. NPDC021056 TaxID=3155012 RepID=UPI003406B8D3
MLWTGWKNTNDIRVPSPPEFRFDAAQYDAAQYDAALAAAADDVSWEDPVHTDAHPGGRSAQVRHAVRSVAPRWP